MADQQTNFTDPDMQKARDACQDLHQKMQEQTGYLFTGIGRTSDQRICLVVHCHSNIGLIRRVAGSDHQGFPVTVTRSSQPRPLVARA